MSVVRFGGLDDWTRKRSKTVQKINMAAPLVSVILPVYNDSFFVKEAIDSILNQTFNSFELIIVDDGSDKSTKNVLANFKNDHR
jgi:cellulose synthase/poly-beta-1,6-N-acetylglucosamine synthase-like glycosyltransferase